MEGKSMLQAKRLSSVVTVPFLGGKRFAAHKHKELWCRWCWSTIIDMRGGETTNKAMFFASGSLHFLLATLAPAAVHMLQNMQGRDVRALLADTCHRNMAAVSVTIVHNFCPVQQEEDS